MNSSLSIFESILLLIALLIISLITIHSLSFIDNYNLSLLLSGIIKLLLLIAYIIFMLKKDRIDREQFQIKRISGVILLFGVIMIHLSILLPQIPWHQYNIAESDINALLTNASIYSLLYGVIIAPIFEELFFRGIILGGLIKEYSPTIALLVSSLMFGVFHPNIVDATVTGVILGYIYYKSSNLLYCILIHISINLTGGVLKIFFKYYGVERVIDYFSKLNNYSIWIEIISSVLLIVGFIGLHFLFKRKQQI